ncbi:MAG: radical SAM protein [Phycisphaerales bacterium]|jgi:cyclic dehypoxanthinyl futalosine synthase|nr:radical SAM protein [Phycisphaeraceae bacterium]
MAAHTSLPTFDHLPGTDEGLLHAVASGQARLTSAQAIDIYHRLPLNTLARFADARCRLTHGDDLRTYIIDRNINYTNVCSAKCTFCAFRRDGDEADAYTLEPAAIYDKIAELVAIGGTQILMQGGMNPALPLTWYTDLLSGIKSRFPKVHVHAFSPPEFIEFVRFFDPPGSTLADKIRWVMVRLRAAGLDSLPGGGGEIFADPVRRKIGLGKCDAEAWLTTMNVAHSLGMFTSATMMFGHIEGPADRVHHMHLVRQWQDRALAAGAGDAAREAMGHYVSFISWPFQRENTPLGRVPDWGADERELSQEFPGDAIARAWDFGVGLDKHPAGTRAADVFNFDAMDKSQYPTAPLFGKRVRMSGASDYLRTQALSRLYLDNIFSIGASWVTMGPHIGQVALRYGANDMGSVMMEENVVSSAGTTYCLDEAVLCRLIRGAGFTPAQRNNTYDIIRVHDGANGHAPDLDVTDWSQHRARKMHQQAPKQAKVAVTIGSK